MPAARPPGSTPCGVDAGGAPALFDTVRPQGAFLTITPFSAPDAATRPEVAHTLIGVGLNREDLLSVAESAARGTAPRQELTVLPFEEAAEAHRRLERGGFRGKVLLVP